MIRGKKRINPSLRGKIETIKSNIRCATRPFDGDGYVFSQAVRELRQEGMEIRYIREKCHYIKVSVEV